MPFGGMGIDMIAGRKRMVWWGYPMYYGGSTAAEIFGVSCINNGSAQRAMQLKRMLKVKVYSKLNI